MISPTKRPYLSKTPLGLLTRVMRRQGKAPVPNVLRNAARPMVALSPKCCRRLMCPRGGLKCSSGASIPCRRTVICDLLLITIFGLRFLPVVLSTESEPFMKAPAKALVGLAGRPGGLLKVKGHGP